MKESWPSPIIWPLYSECLFDQNCNGCQGYRKERAPPLHNSGVVWTSTRPKSNLSYPRIEMKAEMKGLVRLSARAADLLLTGSAYHQSEPSALSAGAADLTALRQDLLCGIINSSVCRSCKPRCSLALNIRPALPSTAQASCRSPAALDLQTLRYLAR